MRLIGYLVAIILLALGFFVLVEGWNTITSKQTLDTKDFLLLVQVAMAFIGAIAAAILTATVGRSNEYIRSALNQSVAEATAKLNAQLGEETGKSLAAFTAELTKWNNLAIEEFKAELTHTGDVARSELNQLAPRRHAAYHTMWAALTQYFRALQKFEAGEFDRDALVTAEKACNDANGLTLLVEQADDDLFHDFWQELTFVFETGNKRSDTPDGVRTVWRNEGRELGDHYLQVRKAFAARLRG